MKYRDRIKGFAKLPATRFEPAPDNYRTHDERQRRMLQGVLKEIGFAGAILVWVPDDAARERLRGTLDFPGWLASYAGPFRGIDGHMRAEELRGQHVGFLVTDLDEREAAKALASFDAVGAQAGRDADKLARLLADVGHAEEEGTNELLDLLRSGDERVPSGEEDPDEPRKAEPYTAKITSPIYEIRGERPELATLVDRTKTQELLAEIERADLPAELADFLRQAAERHSVFHFGRIAEFYAHADAKTQDLMERSALVLIDLDKAIENGFVEMTKMLADVARVSGWKPAGGQDGS